MTTMHVSKVDIENSGELVENMTDIVLLFASIVYECVKDEDFAGAQRNLAALDAASKNLAHIFETR